MVDAAAARLAVGILWLLLRCKIAGKKDINTLATVTFLRGTTTVFFSGFRECLSCKNCISGVTLGLAAASACHANPMFHNKITVVSLSS